MLIGAALGVVGLLVAYFPIPAPTSGQTLATANSEYIIDYAAPLDVLFPRVHFSLEWVGPMAVSGVTVYGCGHDPSCSHPGRNALAAGRGQFGNVSFLGWANLYYQVLPVSGTTNLTVGYAAPVLGGAVGFGLIIGGIVLVAAGFVRPRAGDEAPDGADVDDRPER